MDRTFFNQSFKENNEHIIESDGLIDIYFGVTGGYYYIINIVKIIPKEDEITVIFDIMNYKQEIKIKSEITIAQYDDFIKPCHYNLSVNDTIVSNKKYMYEGSIIIYGKCTIIQTKDIIIDH